MRTMYDQITRIDEYAPEETDFEIPIDEALAHEQFHIEKVHPNVRFHRYSTIDQLLTAVRAGTISLNLYAGVDVGATRHSSDIRILEELPMVYEGRNTTLQVERFARTEKKWPLEEMQNWLRMLMRTGIIRKLNIDGTGIGYHMAQTLENEFPGKVRSLRMNGAQIIRSKVMSNLKNRAEGDGLALAYDRQTIEDLHSIKTSISSSGGNPRFITEEKGLNHGDGAWSLGFASFAGTEFGKPPRRALNAKVSITRPGYKKGANKQLSADQLESISSERQVKNELKRLKSKGASYRSGILKRIRQRSKPAQDLYRRLDPGDHIDNYDR